MSLPDITPRRAAGFAAASAALDVTCCVEPGGSNAVNKHKTHVNLTQSLSNLLGEFDCQSLSQRTVDKHIRQLN